MKPLTVRCTRCTPLNTLSWLRTINKRRVLKFVLLPPPPFLFTINHTINIHIRWARSVFHFVRVFLSFKIIDFVRFLTERLFNKITGSVISFFYVKNYRFSKVKKIVRLVIQNYRFIKTLIKIVRSVKKLIAFFSRSFNRIELNKHISHITLTLDVNLI